MMIDDVDPELRSELGAILTAGLEPNEKLDARLSRLQVGEGVGAHAELIFLATHLRFSTEEALAHWRGVLAHRGAWQERLCEPVDLRAAMLSYFVRVNPRLENPKIVELAVFDRTVSSSYRDGLTGLYNYRFLDDYLTRELGRSERRGTPLSLVMADVDDFKRFNDTRGHEHANRALAEIGRTIAVCLRGADVPVRFGGEEFALVLPDTGKIGARNVAERVRRAVAEHTLTVSVGVATFPGDASDRRQLLRCADQALYAAKRAGKNRVVLYADGTRSFRRRETAIAAICSSLREPALPVTVVRLSEGGMLLRSERGLAVGTLVEVRLRLPGASREIAASGRVVASVAIAAETYESGINIVDLPGADRRLLTGFLRGAA